MIPPMRHRELDYLRELLPQAEFWPVMPPEQTPDRVRDRILEFGRAHR